MNKIFIVMLVVSTSIIAMDKDSVDEKQAITAQTEAIRNNLADVHIRYDENPPVMRTFKWQQRTSDQMRRGMMKKNLEHVCAWCCPCFTIAACVSKCLPK